MTEQLLEQSIEAIKHGDPIEALEILDEETDSTKEKMARIALKKEAFTNETLRDFILKRAKRRKGIPKSIDNDVKRALIREHFARERRKHVIY
jgi:hypothetical protein